jgi:4-alpha-glucanotransferase
MERASGILLHPTSLPGRYGIGTLGRGCLEFIDFLAKAKQKYWQILPLGPTGFADSPYQCFSSFAGNPLLIDLDQLVEEKLLKTSDLLPMKSFDDGPVDYGKLILLKYPVLRKAEANFNENATEEEHEAFRHFARENNGWLDDYALFMSLKVVFDQKPWLEWDKPLKLRNEKELIRYRTSLHDEIVFHQFLQYLFFRQWNRIREYASKHNVRIIGDIPLYIAMDSAEAWSRPELFEFDHDKNPVAVGGVPPDYFSETGQLWGNPLFRWDLHKKTGYEWWINRVRWNLLLYDVIRIDHFRGFVAYWSVPYGEKTAVNGKWIPGPGKELFKAIREALGDIPVIAEDLGVITDDVVELRDSFGLPGMKILQFAFDSAEENDYIPHNFTRNCIVYTGTHDNDTLVGWFSKAKKEDRQYVLDYIHTDEKNVVQGFIRLAFASVAYTAVIPMQDLLGLGTEARMNLPGTTLSNWRWRMKPGQASQGLAEELARITKLYSR